MSHWKERFLGILDLPSELSASELEEFFRFSRRDIADIAEAFRPKYRIAAGVQLGFTRMSGRRLDRFKVLPRALLAFLGEQFDVTPPSIATMRSLYKRGNTLIEHQKWVLDRLGLKYVNRKQEAMLLATVRTASHGTTSIDRLMTSAREWLVERNFVLPAERTLRDICVRASADTEAFIYQSICKAIPAEKRKELVESLMDKRDDGRTLMEWLRKAPKRRAKKNLDEIFERIDHIKSMGIADIELPAMSIERMRSYAREARQRSPSRFLRLSEVSQTLQAVCFLRVTLAEAADVVVHLAGKKYSDLHSKASNNVKSAKVQAVGDYRLALSNVFQLAHDESLTIDDLRKRIGEIEKTFGDEFYPSHEAEVRAELIKKTTDVRPLLKKLAQLGVKGDPSDLGHAGLNKLAGIYDKERTVLPEGQYDVAKVWEEAVANTDRKQALVAFEVATLEALRKGFTRGSCWVDYSDNYRDREHVLIPSETWEKERNRHYALLKLPRTAAEYIKPVLKAVKKGLIEVSKALARGEIEIRDGGLHVERLTKEGEPPEVAAIRKMLEDEIGDVQLPNMMLEMDVLTRFSTPLLGKQPSSEIELLQAYAGPLGHGTEMTARQIAMMIPQLSVADVTASMRACEFDQVIDEANRRVLTFMSGLPFIKAAGDGNSASSDSMSVQTSKHLWNSRLDPRRQTPSVGMYTHVRGPGDIIYHQPIILGNRQVGVAIEGVVRQIDHEITRLAVDTHGYTDVGMGIARGLGFDLCPHLASLSDHKLVIPPEMEFPESIQGAIKSTLQLDIRDEDWDQYVRVLASISNGTTSAVVALRRLGSDAQGDPVYKVAKNLGLLQRTLFLCDYVTKPPFRREIRRLLNRGETVHTLQRSIHVGPVKHDRGRRKDEIVAVSAALTFLSNLVMAWNAYKMGEAVKKLEAKGVTVADALLRHISPARYGGVNFRGVYQFSLDRFGALLLRETRSMPGLRIAGGSGS